MILAVPVSGYYFYQTLLSAHNSDADCILEAIIAMAHAINVRVTAAGVEKDEQLQFLTGAGCDYAQGYLFSEPLCRDDFEALLERDSH